jgi:hypothetical protein
MFCLAQDGTIAIVIDHGVVATPADKHWVTRTKENADCNSERLRPIRHMAKGSLRASRERASTPPFLPHLTVPSRPAEAWPVQAYFVRTPAVLP